MQILELVLKPDTTPTLIFPSDKYDRDLLAMDLR